MDRQRSIPMSRGRSVDRRSIFPAMLHKNMMERSRSEPATSKRNHPLFGRPLFGRNRRGAKNNKGINWKDNERDIEEDNDDSWGQHLPGESRAMTVTTRKNHRAEGGRRQASSPRRSRTSHRSYSVRRRGRSMSERRRQYTPERSRDVREQRSPSPYQRYYGASSFSDERETDDDTDYRSSQATEWSQYELDLVNQAVGWTWDYIKQTSDYIDQTMDAALKDPTPPPKSHRKRSNKCASPRRGRNLDQRPYKPVSVTPFLEDSLLQAVVKDCQPIPDGSSLGGRSDEYMAPQVTKASNPKVLATVPTTKSVKDEGDSPDDDDQESSLFTPSFLQSINEHGGKEEDEQPPQEEIVQEREDHAEPRQSEEIDVSMYEEERSPEEPVEERERRAETKPKEKRAPVVHKYEQDERTRDLERYIEKKKKSQKSTKLSLPLPPKPTQKGKSKRPTMKQIISRKSRARTDDSAEKPGKIWYSEPGDDLASTIWDEEDTLSLTLSYDGDEIVPKSLRPFSWERGDRREAPHEKKTGGANRASRKIITGSCCVFVA